MSNTITAIEEVRLELHRNMPRIKSSLPAHISPEKFGAVIMTALNLNPSLLDCDRQSLFNEACLCAKDGLLPDGREAGFVPFKGKIKYIPMVFGLIKRMRNSGDVGAITAEIVHERDDFRYWIDTEGQHLNHEPMVFGERGNPVGVYAIAKTKEGFIEIEVMSSSQVMDVKDSISAKNSPWNGPFEGEMWRKTVIRRLSKRLPMSAESERTLSTDDDMYDFKKKTKLVESEPQEKLVEIPNQPIEEKPPVEIKKPNNPLAPFTPYSGPINGYVIPFGRYKGKKFEDLHPNDLEKHVTSLETTIKGTPQPQVAEFIKLTQDYLISIEPPVGTQQVSPEEFPVGAELPPEPGSFSAFVNHQEG